VTFWDSSAVVPVLVEQDASSRVARWLAADDSLVVWTLTPVEVLSAFRRLVREGALEEAAAGLAETRLTELVRACHVVIERSSRSCAERARLRRGSWFFTSSIKARPAEHSASGMWRGGGLFNTCW
jgi:predicted nucleic acid-binding protein